MLQGLGKGGVPGSSTTSVALNSLLAPEGQGCLDASVRRESDGVQGVGGRSGSVYAYMYMYVYE